MTAPFLDLRSYLAWMEAAGRLRRVRQPVRKEDELACIARWALESGAEADPCALLFDNVVGHAAPVAVHLFTDVGLYAAALGVSRAGLWPRWSEAMRAPRPPEVVREAPVLECTQSTPDLSQLPIPTWTPGRDAGPYIPSGIVITKDPATGIHNVATYRLQVHDSRTLGIFFGSRLQHAARHHAMWGERGEDTPVAIAIGAAPAVAFGAAAKTAYGVDEMAVAGGLAGAPLPVVRGRTVDLLVPATAEYVLEGRIQRGALRSEGPFGEALGYMNDAAPAPVIHLTALHHRRDPIFHGYVQQLPPSDGHMLMEMGVLGPLWYYLTEKLAARGILDMAIVPGSAGVAALAVQLARSAARDAGALGRALTRLNFGQKFIYFVDEDIDVRDAQTLNWALSSRVDPSRDVTLIDDTTTFQLDPAVMRRAEAAGTPLGGAPYKCSLCIVDATLKCDVPETSLPGAAVMEATARRWPELGLPPLRPRPRLTRLLETHSESALWRRLADAAD